MKKIKMIHWTNTGHDLEVSAFNLAQEILSLLSTMAFRNKPKVQDPMETVH